MGKRNGNARKMNWEAVFANTNILGLQNLGEAEWTLIVTTAQKHLNDAGIVLSTTRETALISLGLYLGATYQRRLTEVKQQPDKVEEPCQPTETA